mmetsp:Transcript_22136/g.44582  ORF Transcript_22136/g.44582 Transcript_22136/m.44582 type:complete len:105 (-) Transcript_22136:126-440(-)
MHEQQGHTPQLTANKTSDKAITAIPATTECVTTVSFGSYLNAVGRISLTQIITIIPLIHPNNTAYTVGVTTLAKTNHPKKAATGSNIPERDPQRKAFMRFPVAK